MSFRAALGFFTRLPVGSEPFSSPFRGMVVWLPAVGLVVGALTAAAVWLTSLILPPALCGVLGCLVWVAVTGGLHLDGVADCGDGLVVEALPARRLEIMKDSRLGTFGGLALFFVLMLKTAALSVLGTRGGATWSGFLFVAGACCLAAVLGRCAVFAAMRLPSARPGGLGEAATEGVARRHERLALAAALGLGLLNGPRGIGALIAAGIVTRLLLSAAKQRLGGVTGDVFGCLVEVVECAVLLVCCAL